MAREELLSPAEEPDDAVEQRDGVVGFFHRGVRI